MRANKGKSSKERGRSEERCMRANKGKPSEERERRD